MVKQAIDRKTFHVDKERLMSNHHGGTKPFKCFFKTNLQIAKRDKTYILGSF